VLGGAIVNQRDRVAAEEAIDRFVPIVVAVALALFWGCVFAMVLAIGSV